MNILEWKTQVAKQLETYQKNHLNTIFFVFKILSWIYKDKKAMLRKNTLKMCETTSFKDKKQSFSVKNRFYGIKRQIIERQKRKKKIKNYFIS